MARKFASGFFRSLQKLKISSFGEDSLFKRITVPLKHLKRIETVCYSSGIADVLESVLTAVEGQLLPVLDTVTLFVKSLPNTTEFVESHLKTLEDAMDEMIYKIFAILRHYLLEQKPLSTSQAAALATSVDRTIDDRVSAVIVALDPPVRERLAGLVHFESVDESLDVVSQCIVSSVTHLLPLETAKRCDSTGFQVLTGTESVNISLKQCLIQAFADIRKNPALTGKLADVLWELTVSFIGTSCSKTDLAIGHHGNRILYTSATDQFTRKLVEILPDVLSGSENDKSL